MAISERRELELRRKLQAERPVWKPQRTNNPQTAAFHCDAQEIGYGGAKGGGKSQLGTGMATMRHHYTNCFRKNYEEHSSMIEFMRTEFPPLLTGSPPVYRPRIRTRKMKVRTMRFCHLEHGDKDLRKYQGKAVDLCWIDECVHFTRRQVEMLAADVRLLKPKEAIEDGVFGQLLLTFNPPLDSVGLWVFDMFGPWINPEHPMYPQPFGKVLYCAFWREKDYFFESGEPLTNDPETGKPMDKPLHLKSRTFFKATLNDNEAYRDDHAYHARLQSLSEVERRAFYDGEMTASLVDLAGQIFRRAKYADAERRWSATTAPTMHPICISVDVTGGGDDRFVVMPFWRGGYVGRPVSCQGNEVPNAEAQVDFVERFLVDELHCKVEDVACIYDSGGGYGNAFYDELHRRYPNMQIVPFNGASVAGVNEIFGDPDPDLSIGPISGMPYMSGANGFLNKRSAAYVRAGQMLEHEAFEIAIPPDDKLRQECMVHLIKERAGKTIQVISKEDVKVAIQRSPDLSDALVMGLHFLSVEIAVVDRFG